MSFEHFSNHELRQALNRTENEEDGLSPAHRHKITEEMTRRSMHIAPYTPLEASERRFEPSVDTAPIPIQLAHLGLVDASEYEYKNPDHIDSTWKTGN